MHIRYTPVHAHAGLFHAHAHASGTYLNIHVYACLHIHVYATTGMRRSFRGGSGGAAGASIHYQDVCSPRYCPGDRSVSKSSNVCITSEREICISAGAACESAQVYVRACMCAHVSAQFESRQNNATRDSDDM